MKLRALLLVLVLALATVAVTVPAVVDGGEDRAVDFIPVKLYVQMSATEATLSTEPSSTNARSSTGLAFTSVELEENLMVEGVPLGVGQHKGLEARIGVSAGVQSVEATVQVLDEDEVIAEDQMTIPSLETRWDWELPFVDDIETYTFTKRHIITLQVSLSRTSFVRTDSDSYLEVRCGDHLGISVETYDGEGRKSTSFYPNDLVANRHVFIEGDVTNPFGPTDIDGVNISIKRPDGTYVVEGEEANVGADMNYSYDWAYASGLPAGTYTINATGVDLQGNGFSVRGSFMMAEFGLRVSAEDEEGGTVTGTTTPGNPAKYTLTVLNIGGKASDVVMDEGDPINLWQTSFSKETFRLDAGDDTDVTFDVMPSSTLPDGESATYTVTATASNDPNVPKEKDSIRVETFIVNEVDLEVRPEKDPDPKDVGVGGTVDHTFTVRNRGTFNTNVDLSKTGVPQGWTADFVGDRVTDDSIEDLRSQEIVDVTLRVTAPTVSDVKKAPIRVRVESREYPDEVEERTFTSNLVIGLALTPTTPTNTTQDPGGHFTIFFNARNNDPTSEHRITFSVEQYTSTWPTSSFTFTKANVVTIPADHTEPMGLEADVPATATAGTFRFTVKGVVDDNPEVHHTFDFNVKINVRHNLNPRLDPERPRVTITTEEVSIVYLIIDNDGNQRETVNVTVELDSSDVDVRMNDAPTSILYNLQIPAGDDEQIKIGFQAKDTAKDAQEITVRISVKAGSSDTPIHPDDFKLVVQLSSAQLLLDYMNWAVIIVIMLVMMAGLLLWNPRKRRAVEEPPEEDDKKAAHGTVARH